MPSHPQHFNNSSLKGSSELGFPVHGMRQKIQKTCCETEKGSDISRERGRCSLSQHWHRDCVSVNPWPCLAGLYNLPVLHSCFASYSCHKYHLFQVLQASDLGRERCLKRISTHLLLVQTRQLAATQCKYTQYKEQNCLLGTALYTNTQFCSTDISMHKKRKRAETNSSAVTEQLLFFLAYLLLSFFPLPEPIQLQHNLSLWKLSVLFTGSSAAQSLWLSP